ncbi:MAG: hypothetical protein ABH877_04205 [bacterium]
MTDVTDGMTKGELAGYRAALAENADANFDSEYTPILDPLPSPCHRCAELERQIDRLCSGLGIGRGDAERLANADG